MLALFCLSAAVLDGAPPRAANPARAQAKPPTAANKTGAASSSAAANPVARWLHGMTLRERVGQLFILPFDGGALKPSSPDYKRLRNQASQLHVGGLILLNRVRYGLVERVDPFALAIFLNRMQRLAKVPLLVAGDFERGASMRVEGATAFPHAMAFAAAGNPAWASQAAELMAAEARALGVHWILAPVADVNNNPDNPVINIRSFGEDPDSVASYVREFLTGMHRDPAHRVLSAVKHFPGHGDTATDSHHALPIIAKDLPALEAVELPPFRAAIAAGTDAVMGAHLGVAAFGSVDLPATLNAKVMTGLLRDQLGFDGLVVTDALDMKGVAGADTPGELAVRAFEAGADVLLMPAQPEKAYAAMLAAIASGRISRERLDRSVRRILQAKARVGLHRKKLVDVELLADSLAREEAERVAEQVVRAGLTLVRNAGREGKGLLPLSRRDGGCLVVLTEARNSDRGLIFMEEIRARRPQWMTRILDPLASPATQNALAEEICGCEELLLAVFAAQARYRNGALLPGELPELVARLINSGPPTILISFGNPYLIRAFPAATAFLAAFTNVPAAETAVAKALFGEIPITGRLPVSIPPVALRGEGISLAVAPESSIINR